MSLGAHPTPAAPPLSQQQQLPTAPPPTAPQPTAQTTTPTYAELVKRRQQQKEDSPNEYTPLLRHSKHCMELGCGVCKLKRDVIACADQMAQVPSPPPVASQPCQAPMPAPLRRTRTTCRRRWATANPATTSHPLAPAHHPSTPPPPPS